MLTPQDKAKCGLWLLEEAIVDFLAQHGGWVSHAEIQDELNLRSEYKGANKGYLSGSIIERLIKQNRVIREGEGRGTKILYCIADSN